MLPLRLLAVIGGIFFIAGMISTIIAAHVPFPGAVASGFFLSSVFLFYTASDISWLIPVEQMSGVPQFERRANDLATEIDPHINKPLKTAKDIKCVQSYFTIGSAKADARTVASGARDGLLYVLFGQLAILLITVAMGYVAEQDGVEASLKDVVVSFGFSLMAFLVFAIWWVSRLMFVRRKLDAYCK